MSTPQDFDVPAEVEWAQQSSIRTKIIVFRDKPKGLGRCALLKLINPRVAIVRKQHSLETYVRKTFPVHGTRAARYQGDYPIDFMFSNLASINRFPILPFLVRNHAQGPLANRRVMYMEHCNGRNLHELSKGYHRHRRPLPELFI